MIIILKFKVLASYILVMVALILLKDPTSDKYVDTVSTPISLEKVIEEAIDLSKHPLLINKSKKFLKTLNNI